MVVNALAIHQTRYLIIAWMSNWKERRRIGRETKMRKMNGTPGLEGIPLMEANMVRAFLMAEMCIMVETCTAAPIIGVIPIMATNMAETPTTPLVEETTIIKGTPIISIVTKVAARTMEARDLDTMTMTYTTMPTSTLQAQV